MGDFMLKDRSFNFSVKLLRYFRTLTADREFDILKRQVMRSAASIGANITEGMSGTSRKDLSRFFRISLRSCNETTYWLQLIAEVYEAEINAEQMNELISESKQISRILGKSILSLKTTSKVVQN
jgi:four helix bundle protein